MICTHEYVIKLAFAQQKKYTKFKKLAYSPLQPAGRPGENARFFAAAAVVFPSGAAVIFFNIRLYKP
jgi:hypothetical protein